MDVRVARQQLLDTLSDDQAVLTKCDTDRHGRHGSERSWVMLTGKVNRRRRVADGGSGAYCHSRDQRDGVDSVTEYADVCAAATARRHVALPAISFTFVLAIAAIAMTAASVVLAARGAPDDAGGH